MPIRYLQHDRDRKFAPAFDRILKRRRVTVVTTPKCAPNCQAYVERFIDSLRWECLDHFVFFGLRHLDSVAANYLAHYLEERPHQGLENELLSLPKVRPRATKENAAISLRQVQCQQRLGGLLKHYSRKAA